MIRHGLDLTGEQVDSSRRFGLVGVINGEESICPYFAPPLLPHLAHFAFRFLQEETRSTRAVLFVALQLVARVATAAVVAAVVDGVTTDTNSAGRCAVTADAYGMALHNCRLLLLLLQRRKERRNAARVLNRVAHFLGVGGGLETKHKKKNKKHRHVRQHGYKLLS